MKKQAFSLGFSAAVLIVLILDARAASQYAWEGLQICMKALIPSLFPLLFLSVYMNQALLELHFPALRLVGRFCKIPAGSESVLILGLLGGYPVGAQMISQCYQNGSLDAAAARRMSGFCNNAGPAFLFGVCGLLFQSVSAVWTLWGIQILSALITAALLPGRRDCSFRVQKKASISLPEALQKSISIMAGICGWVVVFRVLIGICSRWFLWLTPLRFQLLFTGFLELSNGITALTALSGEAERFLFASCLLSAGGLCVSMQTATALSGLGCGTYLRGKAIQTFLSFLLAYSIQFLIFSAPALLPPMALCGILLAGVPALLLLRGYRRKKDVAFHLILMYNRRKPQKERSACCSEKKCHDPAATASTEPT